MAGVDFLSVYSSFRLIVIKIADSIKYGYFSSLHIPWSPSMLLLCFRFQRNKMFLRHSLVKIQYCGEPPWPRDSVLGLRPQGSNFVSCVCRAVSSYSPHQPQEVHRTQRWHKNPILFISFHLMIYAWINLINMSSLTLYLMIPSVNSQIGPFYFQRFGFYVALYTLGRKWNCVNVLLYMADSQSIVVDIWNVSVVVDINFVHLKHFFKIIDIQTGPHLYPRWNPWYLRCLQQ